MFGVRTSGVLFHMGRPCRVFLGRHPGRRLFSQSVGADVRLASMRMLRPIPALSRGSMYSAGAAGPRLIPDHACCIRQPEPSIPDHRALRTILVSGLSPSLPQRRRASTEQAVDAHDLARRCRCRSPFREGWYESPSGQSAGLHLMDGQLPSGSGDAMVNHVLSSHRHSLFIAVQLPSLLLGQLA